MSVPSSRRDAATAGQGAQAAGRAEAEVDEIARLLVFDGSADEQEYLALAPLTISDLDERYGDQEEDTIW